jgi:hypothetical protein
VRSAGNDPAVAILACEHIEAAFGWPLLIKEDDVLSGLFLSGAIEGDGSAPQPYSGESKYKIKAIGSLAVLSQKVLHSSAL